MRLAELNIGDLLQWHTSSAGKRTGRVVDKAEGWLMVGEERTPRQQGWLNNEIIRVMLVPK